MPEGGEQPVIPEQPLSREEIVLAQAEIDELLGEAFRYTPLDELFSPFQPQKPLQGVLFKGYRRDYKGTRNISGVGNQRINERELYIYLKSRQRRREGVDVGQVIRLVEPGSGSARNPQIEHLIIEYAGGFRASNPPNTPTTVNRVLELARAISTSR